MSNYLANLVARSFTRAEAIQPRLPSRFEPITTGAMADAAPATDMTVAEAGAEEHSAAVHRGLQVVEHVRPVAPASAQRRSHLDAETAAQVNSSRGQHLSPPDAQVTSTDAAPASEGEAKETDARDEQQSPQSRAPIRVAVVAYDHAPASPRQRARSKRAARPDHSWSSGAIRPVVEPQAEVADADDRQASQAASRQELIQVTIGRIEVRAVTPAPPAKPQSAPRSNTLSLTDYLNGRMDDRAGGGR